VQECGSRAFAGDDKGSEARHRALTEVDLRLKCLHAQRKPGNGPAIGSRRIAGKMGADVEQVALNLG